MARKGCEGRQHSDQIICERCGLQWDVNDPEPPLCNPRTVLVATIDTPRNRALLATRAMLSNDKLS